MILFSTTSTTQNSMTASWHDVGHGGFSTLRINAGGHETRVVYDCGSKSRELVKTAVAVEFPEGGFKESVDLLVLSHFDADHVNCLKILSQYAKVRRVVAPIWTPNTISQVVDLDREGWEERLEIAEAWLSSEEAFVIEAKRIFGDDCEVLILGGSDPDVSLTGDANFKVARSNGQTQIAVDIQVGPATTPVAELRTFLLEPLYYSNHEVRKFHKILTGKDAEELTSSQMLEALKQIALPVEENPTTPGTVLSAATDVTTSPKVKVPIAPPETATIAPKREKTKSLSFRERMTASGLKLWEFNKHSVCMAVRSLEGQETALLWTGDANCRKLTPLLDQLEDFESVNWRVVQVPHHGSKSSSGAEFATQFSGATLVAHGERVTSSVKLAQWVQKPSVVSFDGERDPSYVIPLVGTPVDQHQKYHLTVLMKSSGRPGK